MWKDCTNLYTCMRRCNWMLTSKDSLRPRWVSDPFRMSSSSTTRTHNWKSPKGSKINPCLFSLRCFTLQILISYDPALRWQTPLLVETQHTLTLWLSAKNLAQHEVSTLLWSNIIWMPWSFQHKAQQQSPLVRQSFELHNIYHTHMILFQQAQDIL